jgi:ribonuclease-3
MPSELTTAALERALGYNFNDVRLITAALTHTSYASEHEGAASYERLEFLGDAVLELATTEIIFSEMSDSAEGAMTKLRAAVVDEATLARVARLWLVPEAVLLGVGEERSGGRDRDSILSDVVEAVLAAVYIDGGLQAAASVVDATWRPIISERLSRPHTSDARSQLQEQLAQNGKEVTFTYTRSGPDHAAVFAATASVEGNVIAQGSGGSKKAAAIDAARIALHRVPRVADMQ